MNNIVNTSPYLVDQRSFSKEGDDLNQDLDKSYVDIANAVNSRTIGIYAINRPSVTGNQFYPENVKLQSLRQIYVFTGTSAIPHGLTLSDVPYMANMEGYYYDDTNWYGLMAASTTAITGQISFYLDETNINFVVDGAAPSLTKGMIILEWLSNI